MRSYDAPSIKQRLNGYHVGEPLPILRALIGINPLCNATGAINPMCSTVVQTRHNSVAQILQFTRPIPHNMPFCNQNKPNVHISVTKSCIVGYMSDAMWDLWNGSNTWGQQYFQVTGCPKGNTLGLGVWLPVVHDWGNINMNSIVRLLVGQPNCQGCC